MRYLSGAVRPELFDVPEFGVMLQPAMGNRVPLDRVVWAADNGCFSMGARFDLDRFLRWLWARRAYTATCLFAVAPDVYGDAVATWQRSAHVLPAIRGLGFRAALVAQDGWEHAPVDWAAFDCLFIGGTNTFKADERTYALIGEARQRGKHTHLGRVNTWRRLRAARAAGYDSVDGTYLTRGPDQNTPRLRRWVVAITASLRSHWSTHEQIRPPCRSPALSRLPGALRPQGPGRYLAAM